MDFDNRNAGITFCVKMSTNVKGPVTAPPNENRGTLFYGNFDRSVNRWLGLLMVELQRRRPRMVHGAGRLYASTGLQPCQVHGHRPVFLWINSIWWYYYEPGSIHRKNNKSYWMRKKTAVAFLKAISHNFLEKLSKGANIFPTWGALGAEVYRVRDGCVLLCYACSKVALQCCVFEW
jgi:hypothetical protein